LELLLRKIARADAPYAFYLNSEELTGTLHAADGFSFVVARR
jgi:hypothetical protein